MQRVEGVSELLPACNTVIFDEAHQLPETARLFFGETISSAQLVDLARDARAELRAAGGASPEAERLAKLMEGPTELALAAAAILGMKGSTFPARKALSQARRLGGPRIRRAIVLLADADLDLRGVKAWPEELVMEVLVARLCQLART